MTRGEIVAAFARYPINDEQIVDAFDNLLGDGLPRRQFVSLEDASACMRPTCDMDHLRPAHLFVGDIAVGLQQSFEISQKPLWPVPPPAQLKLEHHATSRPAVLPEISLMILPPPIVHLHVHRRFIRLDISPSE